jgi:hypothetical protein
VVLADGPRVHDGGDTLAGKAIQPERGGEKLLQQLKNSKPRQPQYQQAQRVLVAAGREHIDFEQNELFPKFEAGRAAKNPPDPQIH